MSRTMFRLGRGSVLTLAIVNSTLFSATRAQESASPVMASNESVELAPIRNAAMLSGSAGLEARTSKMLSDEQRLVTIEAELATKNVAEPGKEVDVLLVNENIEGEIVPHVVLRRVRIDAVERTYGISSGVEQFPLATVTLVIPASKIEDLRVSAAEGVLRLKHATPLPANAFSEVMSSFVKNLFQPLLLFFFMGFLVPLLKVPFEYPKALYQAITIYLLVAIGWHGGVLMASQSASEFAVAGKFAVVGFLTNLTIGIAATVGLRAVSKLRRVDAVTVGAYYGSDSAGTFVTCLGALSLLGITSDSYMPVMLAVMEIPGCLVGLYLVSRLRARGLDARGFMPDEPGYTGEGAANGNGNGDGHEGHGGFNLKILHEVFLNPGLYMLFGGIAVGLISGSLAKTDPKIIEEPNHFFVFPFKGILCLFLLEMGMTACRHLRDLKTAGIGFLFFGVGAPTVFAVFGMAVMHLFSMAIGHPFQHGSYALFACLCGAASYIAVPAVQRLAIPESSPTLPLAASLGLTFTWNVTMGIPLYLVIAKQIMGHFPIGTA